MESKDASIFTSKSAARRPPAAAEELRGVGSRRSGALGRRSAEEAVAGDARVEPRLRVQPQEQRGAEAHHPTEVHRDSRPGHAELLLERPPRALASTSL